MRAQGLQIQGRTGPEDDADMNQFPPLLIRSGDCCTLQNSLMLGDSVVYFDRIDVFPASDDQVIDAIDNEYKSICIHVTGISRVHPAIAQALRSLFGFIPIPLHYAGTAHYHFADHITRYLATIVVNNTNVANGGRHTCRARFSQRSCCGQMIVMWQKGGNRRQLGHAVDLEHLYLWQARYG